MHATNVLYVQRIESHTANSDGIDIILFTWLIWSKHSFHFRKKTNKEFEMHLRNQSREKITLRHFVRKLCEEKGSTIAKNALPNRRQIQSTHFIDCELWCLISFPVCNIFFSLLDDVAVSHWEYTMRQRWKRCQTCSSCVLPFVWNFCETTHSTATMLTIWAMVSLPPQQKKNQQVDMLCSKWNRQRRQNRNLLEQFL